MFQLRLWWEIVLMSFSSFSNGDQIKSRWGFWLVEFQGDGFITHVISNLETCQIIIICKLFWACDAFSLINHVSKAWPVPAVPPKPVQPETDTPRPPGPQGPMNHHLRDFCREMANRYKTTFFCPPNQPLPWAVWSGSIRAECVRGKLWKQGLGKSLGCRDEVPQALCSAGSWLWAFLASERRSATNNLQVHVGHLTRAGCHQKNLCTLFSW